MSRFQDFDDQDTYNFQMPSDPPPRPAANPYASPTHMGETAERELANVDVTATKTSFSSVVGRAWHVFSANMSACIGGMFLAGVIMFLFSLVFQAIFGMLLLGSVSVVEPQVIQMEQGMEMHAFQADEGGEMDQEDFQRLMSGSSARPNAGTIMGLGIMGTIFFLLYLLFPMWIFTGMVRFFNAIIRHNEVNYALIFSGGNALVRMLLYYLLVVIVIVVAVIGLLLVVVLPISIVAATINSPALVIIGAGVVYAIILLMSIYAIPGFWLLADRVMGVGEALSQSFRMGRANLWTMILLALWYLLLAIPGVMLAFLGMGIGYAVGAAMLIFGLCMVGYFVWMVAISSYICVCWCVFCMQASGEGAPQSEWL